MSLNSDKAQLLAEIEGYDDPIDMMQDSIMDSVCYGICMNPDCDYTTEVEPDSRTGWCECCETNTVKSIQELMLF